MGVWEHTTLGMWAEGSEPGGLHDRGMVYSYRLPGLLHSLRGTDEKASHQKRGVSQTWRESTAQSSALPASRARG
jgi:hypothetical protein